MCGLSGYIRTPINNPTPASVYSAFVNLFITSQLRGFDSSGATTIWKQRPKAFKVGKKTRTGLFTVKDLTDPMTIWKSLDYYVNKRCEKNADTHDKPYLQAVIAHCRAATIGNVANENAHPFIFHNNRFIGTHNGTISNAVEIFNTLVDKHEPIEGTLPPSKDYSDAKAGYTDSETVLFCIYRWGIDKVYPLIRGAFAFVWYDQATASIYFCRNNQRTLHYTFSKVSDTLFYSSERRMVDFAIRRELDDNNKMPIISFETGKVYRTSVSHHKFIKYDAEDFPWDSVIELEEARPAGTSNFTQAAGFRGNTQTSKQTKNTGNGSSNKNSVSCVNVLRMPPVTRENSKPVHFEVHNFDKNEEEQQLDARETSCLCCHRAFTDKDKTTKMAVKGHGYVCEDCTGDLNTVEEIINDYPVLSDDPEWMKLWVKRSTEQENRSGYAN